MPELPEVETIKNDLRDLVLGRTIVAVDLRDPELVRHPDPSTFVSGLTGTTLVASERRGKYLLLGLSTGDYVALQLMITGQFLLAAAAAPVPKSTRLILALDDGRQLRLVDQGRYARAHLVRAERMDGVLRLDQLGPDPTAADFTLARFAALVRPRRGRIKPLSLDQRFLAGLGNIYVDEALFLAGIHPASEANTLNDEEVARLYEAIRHVLLAGIAKRGTTVATYRDVLGRRGRYQEDLRVFRRAGKPCPRCGTPIGFVRLGGRDTHYCPRCQALP